MMSYVWDLFFPKPQAGWFGLPAPQQLAEQEAEIFDKVGRTVLSVIVLGLTLMWVFQFEFVRKGILKAYYTGKTVVTTIWFSIVQFWGDIPTGGSAPTVNGHCWNAQDNPHGVTYCSHCSMLIKPSSWWTRRVMYQCGICGRASHQWCRRQADRLPCKHPCAEDRSHHLVEGNLPPSSVCEVCGLSCASMTALAGKRCIWCDRTVHDSCAKSLLPDCDYGIHSDLVLPPTAVCGVCEDQDDDGNKENILKNSGSLDSNNRKNMEEKSAAESEADKKMSTMQTLKDGANNFGEMISQGFKSLRVRGSPSKDDLDQHINSGNNNNIESTAVSSSSPSPPNVNAEPADSSRGDKQRPTMTPEERDNLTLSTINKSRDSVSKPETISKTESRESAWYKPNRNSKLIKPAFDVFSGGDAKIIKDGNGSSSAVKPKIGKSDTEPPGTFDAIGSSRSPMKISSSDPQVDSLARQQYEHSSGGGQSVAVDAAGRVMNDYYPGGSAPPSVHPNQSPASTNLSSQCSPSPQRGEIFEQPRHPGERGDDGSSEIELNESKLFATCKQSPPERHATPLERQDSWASHASNVLERVVDRVSSRPSVDGNGNGNGAGSRDLAAAVKPPPRKSWGLRRSVSGDRKDQLFPPWTTANMADFQIIPEKVKHKVLLVFLNPLSGGQLGRALVEKFRRFLNPLQVVDLSKDKPEKALELFRCVAEEENLVVVVCGGDGSAGWIMDSISQTYPGLHVPLGMLPLGTGNDLAQVLGWGAGYTLEDDLSKFLRRVHSSTTSIFDRWKVTYLRIRSPEDEQKARKSTKYLTDGGAGGGPATSPVVSKSISTEKFRDPISPDGKEQLPALETQSWVMNNYMDIGVVARIVSKFHNVRESNPELFKSRIGNKYRYGELSFEDMMSTGQCDISQVTLYCDNKQVRVPKDAASIVIINIPSFSGGANLWPDRDVMRVGGFNTPFMAMGGTSPVAAASTTDNLPSRSFGWGDRSMSPTRGTRRSNASSPRRAMQQTPSMPSFDTVDDVASMPARASSAGNYERFFPNASWKRQSYKDGILEVVAVRSLFHMAQITVGVAQPERICQGSELKLFIPESDGMPFQVDGEPQKISGPGLITIGFAKQSLVLIPTSVPNVPRGCLHMNQITEMINDMCERQTIDRRTRKALLRELARRAA
eukprot:gene329-1126_t